MTKSYLDPPPDFRKRQAVRSDFDLIFQIKKEALYKYIDAIWGWDERQQINLLTNNFDPRRYTIIECDSKAAGIYEVAEEDDCIDVINIELREDFRNRGIGTSLLNETMATARIKEKPVKLRVFKENLRAQRFYRKLGFTVSGETENHLEMCTENRWENRSSNWVNSIP